MITLCPCIRVHDNQGSFSTTSKRSLEQAKFSRTGQLIIEPLFTIGLTCQIEHRHGMGSKLYHIEYPMCFVSWQYCMNT